MQYSDKPLQELKLAQSQIEEMRKSNALDQFEECWKEFLRRLERVWYKATNHYSRSPKWNGWKGKYEKARRKDPLLSYLVNARGADEHTVGEITGREPGGIGINPAEGNSLFIESLEVNNGVIKVKSPQRLRIDFIPGKVKLLPVTNYGRTYEVPNSHLGSPVDPANAIEIAEIAIRYYSKFLEGAEKYFVK
jgi:hypothetical protein